MQNVMNKTNPIKILGVLLMPVYHLTVEAVDIAETDVFFFVLLVKVQLSGELFLLSSFLSEIRHHNFKFLNL